MASETAGILPPGSGRNGFESDLGQSDLSSLIDLYLKEQRQLSAVERFSQRHSGATEPTQARYYRDLMPATLPKTGQQYAFQVDLDRCSGCKACVSACHSMNGLDDNETWREVGFLVGKQKPTLPQGKRIPLEVVATATMQTVTTACHHCVDPGCLSGCPVLAYEKDPVTGIVRHLDDQCIGCTYCVMKCPYEVPKYSPKRGIVRKCDMCQGRLAVGEAPACVQACPSVAIAIRVVDVDTTLARAERLEFLPASPDPRITKPTTRYLTRRDGLELRAADDHRTTPQPAHWPLVFLLVFSQLGAGGFLAATALDSTSASRAWLAVGSWIALQIGLISSVFHLGRPLKAWRGFLGWRRSWLSRELIALSAFAGVASTLVASVWVGHIPVITAKAPSIVSMLQIVAKPVAGWWIVALSGAVGVFSSLIVYVDTRRPFWNPTETGLRFFGTLITLGYSLAWICSTLTGSTESSTFAKIVLVASSIRILHAAAMLRSGANTLLAKTVSLHLHHYCKSTAAWLALWAMGGIIIPILALAGIVPAGVSIPAFVALVTGDLLERRLFFTTVAPVKMPGGSI